MYVLLLDRYHLGDPLFANALARTLAKPGRPPCLVVHGGGDAAERAFEAAGVFPERRNGVVVPSTVEEAVVVERAVRETNRKLVAALSDAVVHAVGLQGADRRLLRPEGEALAAGDVTWLRTLVGQGVVPVVSALVAVDGGPAREVPTAAAAHALAAALAAAGAHGEAVTVAVFTRANRPGLVEDGAVRASVSCRALPEGAVDEPAAVCALVEEGVDVLLTSVAGLGAAGGVQGTRVTA